MTKSEAGRLGGLKTKPIWARKKEASRQAYEQNPLLCKHCYSPLTYEDRRVGKKFCNRSCSASFFNKGVRRHGSPPHPCLNCGSPTSNLKYCKSECERQHYLKTLDALIAKTGIVDLSPKTARKYLIYKRGHRCEECKLDTWMGSLIPLVLDHKNGNSDDNRETNLRLICNNCDGLTSTFKGRNRGKGRLIRRLYRKKIKDQHGFSF